MKKPSKKIFIALFAFIGVGMLVASYAASLFSISVEPEKGQLSGNASIISDASASNGAYTKFGNGFSRGQHIIYLTGLKKCSDGKTIESQQIWRMKADGSEAAQLTNDNSTTVSWVRPSPDGTKILYYKQPSCTGVNDTSQEKVLWMMNGDGSNQHEVMRQSQYNWTLITHGEWSPDSTKFVQAVNLPNFSSQLFIFNADGSNPQQITNNAKIDGKDITTAFDPSWATNSEIIFIRMVENICPSLLLGVFCKQDLFRININTKQETRVTNDSRTYWDPNISPDGKTYVMLNWDCVICSSNLYKLDTSTPNPVSVPLIADGGTNTNGTFSPDGQYYIFPKQESWGLDTWRNIYKIKLDGTGLTRISQSKDHSTEDSPAYQ